MPPISDHLLEIILSAATAIIAALWRWNVQVQKETLLRYDKQLEAAHAEIRDLYRAILEAKERSRRGVGPSSDKKA